MKLVGLTIVAAVVAYGCAVVWAVSCFERVCEHFGDR